LAISHFDGFWSLVKGCGVVVVIVVVVIVVFVVVVVVSVTVVIVSVVVSVVFAAAVAVLLRVGVALLLLIATIIICNAMQSFNQKPDTVCIIERFLLYCLVILLFTTVVRYGNTGISQSV